MKVKDLIICVLQVKGIILKMEKNLPKFLTEKIVEQYGENIAQEIFKGLLENKKTTFRVNKIKSNIEEVRKILNDNNISFENVDFYEDAFIVEKDFEEKLRSLELYNSGKIYMQSLSSMMPVLYLNPKEKENILDMCSAPRRKNDSNC